MRYVAIGGILGRYLPDEPTQLGAALIRRGTQAEIEQVASWRVRPNLTPNDAALVIDSADVQLKTNHVIEITVNAEDDNKAEVAVGDELTRVVAMLHTAVPAPYAASLGQLRTASETTGAFGLVGGVRGVPVQPPPSTLFDTLNDRLKKLQGNATARTAARHLQNGVGLLWLTDGQTPNHTPIVQASGLLNLFQCIEAIAQRVTASSPPSSAELEPQRRTIVSQLATALAKGKPLAQQVDRIHEAARALNRLELRYLDLRIDRAGTVLGLDALVISEAKQLNKFRNDHLGHPRTKPPSAAEITKWTQDDRAFLVAVAYLQGYLDHLA